MKKTKIISPTKNSEIEAASLQHVGSPTLGQKRSWVLFQSDEDVKKFATNYLELVIDRGKL